MPAGPWCACPRTCPDPRGWPACPRRNRHSATGRCARTSTSAGHLPRWAHPVQRHRHRLKTSERPHFFLTDVVRPAPAVAAHRPGQHQQRQHRAVDRVAVEPVADTATHDDHRPPAGLLRAARELSGHPDGLGGRNSGDRLLPRRGVLLTGIVVPGGPFARQARSRHGILGEHQVEDGAHQVLAHPADRNTARHGRAFAVDGVEAGQVNQRGVVTAGAAVHISHTQRRDEATEVQVPLADTVLAVAESQRALRHHDLVGGRVAHHGLERRVLGALEGLPRSAAVRFFPGTSMSPRWSSLIRNGRSVQRRAKSAKNRTCLRT